MEDDSVTLVHVDDGIDVTVSSVEQRYTSRPIAPPSVASKATSYAVTLFPPLTWLPLYKLKYLRGDIVAGLTVGAMIVPQGMAYALLAGLPTEFGLYTALLPTVLYALLGTSGQTSIGPSALLALLTGAALEEWEVPETDAYIALNALLCLEVALIMIVLGFCRLGFVVNLLSHEVLSGFVSAAAILIICSQLKNMFGLQGMPRTIAIYETIWEFGRHADTIHGTTILLGSVALLFLLVVKFGINKRVLKHSMFFVPGPILAVIGGTLVSYYAHLGDKGVAVVGDIPSRLPDPMNPFQGSLDTALGLAPVATIMALLSFVENVSVAKKLLPEEPFMELNSSQELIALGSSCLGAAFFQGFAATGGFSRSAVNANSGSITTVSSMVSALVVLLTILVLTPVLYHLPLCILAAIIMQAAIGLVDVQIAVHLWDLRRFDLLMWLITFVGTLMLGIEAGILVPLALSVIVVLYKASYPRIVAVGRVEDTRLYTSVEDNGSLVVPGVVALRIDAPLFYANALYVRDRVADELAPWSDTRVVVVDLYAVDTMDASSADALASLCAEVCPLHKAVVLCNVSPQAQRLLRHTELVLERVQAEAEAETPRIGCYVCASMVDAMQVAVRLLAFPVARQVGGASFEEDDRVPMYEDQRDVNERAPLLEG